MKNQKARVFPGKAAVGLAVLIFSLLAVQRARADVWVTNNAMFVARYAHTATLLPNGQVLVAGGYNGPAGALTNAELYNPTTKTWTLTGGMNNPRYEHTATLLTNGLVLVTGGLAGGASAELYDPVSGIWSNTAPMSYSRYQHTATLLTNGLVLVTGGENGSVYLTNAEIYNPAMATWTQINGMHTARATQTATRLPGGQVLVAGGCNYNGGLSYLASAELFDPASGLWLPTNSMTSPRSWATATLLGNGRVLAAGGSHNSGGELASAELYFSTNGAWSGTNSMATARQYHTATLLPNGQVLVAGGYGLVHVGTLASAELFDPVAGVWTATSNTMTSARYLHSATLLPSGQVLVAGGFNGSYLASSELYYPNPPLAKPTTLTGAVILANGSFQFGFTNTPGATFTASCTTNLGSSAVNWTILGAITEFLPGQFQFTDAPATNGGQRFYRVSSPCGSGLKTQIPVGSPD